MATPLLELLKNREVWLVGFCGLCLAWVEMAMIAHLVLYLTEVLLFSVVIAGGLLAMAEAAGAIARPGSGLLSDRVFGHIVDISGSYELAWLSLAFVAAFCVLLLLFVSEGKRKI